MPHAIFLLFCLFLLLLPANGITCDSRLGDFPIQLTYSTEIIGKQGCVLSGYPGASTSIAAVVGTSDGNLGSRLVSLQDTVARDIQIIIDVKYAHLSPQAPMVITILRTTASTSSNSWTSILAVGEGQLPPRSIITIANSTLTGNIVNAPMFAIMSVSLSSVGAGTKIIIESNTCMLYTTATTADRSGAFMGFHVSTTSANPTVNFPAGSLMSFTGNSMFAFASGSGSAMVTMGLVFSRATFVFTSATLSTFGNQVYADNINRDPVVNADRFAFFVLNGGLRMRDGAIIRSDNDLLYSSSVPKLSIWSLSSNVNLQNYSYISIARATLSSSFQPTNTRSQFHTILELSSVAVMNLSSIVVDSANLKTNLPAVFASALQNLAVAVVASGGLNINGGSFIVSNTSTTLSQNLSVSTLYNVTSSEMAFFGRIELRSAAHVSVRECRSNVTSTRISFIASMLFSGSVAGFVVESSTIMIAKNRHWASTMGDGLGHTISLFSFAGPTEIILNGSSTLSIEHNMINASSAREGGLSLYAGKVEHSGTASSLFISDTSSVRISRNIFSAGSLLSTFSLFSAGPLFPPVQSTDMHLLLYKNQRYGNTSDSTNTEAIDFTLTTPSIFIVACSNTINNQADLLPAQFKDNIKLESFKEGDACKFYRGADEPLPDRTRSLTFSSEILHTNTSSATLSKVPSVSRSQTLDVGCPTDCANITLADTELNMCGDSTIPFQLWNANSSDKVRDTSSSSGLPSAVKGSLLLQWATSHPLRSALTDTKSDDQRVMVSLESYQGGVRLFFEIFYASEARRYDTLTTVPILLLFTCGGRPIEIVLRLEPEGSDGPTLSETAKTLAGVVAIINGAMLVGGGAATEMQSIAMLSLTQCNEGPVRAERKGLALRSIAPLATSESCEGALIGNTILVVGVAILQSLALVIVKVTKKMSWCVAMDWVRFPSLTLMVIAFAQNGFLLCGMEVGGNTNAAGYLAAAWTIIPPLIYVGLAQWVISRAYYPVMYRATKPFSHVIALVLPSGTLDKSVTGWGMFSAVVGQLRLPRSPWAISAFMPFLSMVPIAVSGTGGCKAAFTVTVALCLAFAALLVAARPYKTLLTNVLQASMLCLNAAVAIVYMALSNANPYQVDSTLSSALDALVTVQTLIGVVTFVHIFVLFIIRHSRDSCTQLQPYPLSCEWEVANWPSNSGAAKGTTLFNIVEKNAIDLALRETHFDNKDNAFGPDNFDSSLGFDVPMREVQGSEKWLLDKMDKLLETEDDSSNSGSSTS